MPGCGRPIPVSDVFWTSTTIFNLGANQLLACLFAARIKWFFRSIVYKNYFTISLKYRRHLKCKLSWKPSWDPEKTTCSINLLCFTPILHGCFHDLGSWSNIFFDWNNTAYVWQPWMFVSTPFFGRPWSRWNCCVFRAQFDSRIFLFTCHDSPAATADEVQAARTRVQASGLKHQKIGKQP